MMREELPVCQFVELADGIGLPFESLTDDGLSLTRSAVVKGSFSSFFTCKGLCFFLSGHTRALAHECPCKSEYSRSSIADFVSTLALSPVLLIALVLPTNHLFDQCGP
jgi:hypothetical protein